MPIRHTWGSMRGAGEGCAAAEVIKAQSFDVESFVVKILGTRAPHLNA